MNTHHNPLESAPAISFFRATSGRPTAVLQWSDGRERHLHSIVKPEAEGEFFSDIEFWGDVIVFLGVGLGYHVASHLQKVPSHSKLLVIDYYPELVDYCKSYVFTNLTNSIAGISSVTPDISQQLSAFTQGTRTIQFVRHPASYYANRQFYDRIAGVLCPANKNPPVSSYPASVLVFYGDFFLEKELLNAVTTAGIRAIPFEYSKFSGEPSFEAELSRVLQVDKPDLMLNVNMKGFDGSGIVAQLSQRYGIPVAVWFVDDPHPILLYQSQFVRRNIHAFCWERGYIPWLSKKSFGSVSWLPLATDPELFPIAKSTNGPCTAIGFTGSSMGRAFLADIAARFMWKKELEPLAQKSAQELLRNPRSPVPEAIDTICRMEGIPRPFADDINFTWFVSYVIHLASMLRRKEIIGALVPLGIEMFGDPEGWREMFGEAVVVHDNVDYRNGLAALYKNIEININSTSCQMSTAVNQRVFDVPSCGGFIISDDQEDIHTLFAADEIVVYRNTDELKKMISEYRRDSRAILQISQKAHQRILSEHTYKKRIEKMIEIIFGKGTSR